jgi:predicted RNase H-like HicB family nuclease
MLRYYPAIIERGTVGFGVFFPDLPGCTSAGSTLQDAARNAEEALQAHLDLIAEHGESIPDPSEIDCLDVESDIDAVAWLLVRAEVSSQLRLDPSPA